MGIIWSLQAGLVLAALGGGFWFVQNNVSTDAAEGLFTIGVLALSLGVGFTASALLADAQGFSHEEIADQMGLRPASPKALLFRARRSLVRIGVRYRTRGHRG